MAVFLEMLFLGKLEAADREDGDRLWEQVEVVVHATPELSLVFGMRVHCVGDVREKNTQVHSFRVATQTYFDIFTHWNNKKKVGLKVKKRTWFKSFWVAT